MNNISICRKAYIVIYPKCRWILNISLNTLLSDFSRSPEGSWAEKFECYRLYPQQHLKTLLPKLVQRYSCEHYFGFNASFSLVCLSLVISAFFQHLRFLCFALLIGSLFDAIAFINVIKRSVLKKLMNLVTGDKITLKFYTHNARINFLFWVWLILNCRRLEYS